MEAVSQFRLRSYQQQWKEAVRKDRDDGYSRLLISASGGLGKTSFFAALAKEEWEMKNGRTLVLENRDKLVRQTADRIRNETGLDVDIEMAGSHASPYAVVVVASVQSLARLSRLTGFSSNHFSLIVPDEAHYSLSDSFQRVISYFHYGAESIVEGWVKPKDGTYTPIAHVIGTTATPYIGERRNLGELYQRTSVNYSYPKAVEEGWLVGMKQTSIPIKIDTSKFRIKRSSQGMDFSAEDEAAAIIPIINELADQIVLLASDKKGMAFLPSVETARMMAEALTRKGLNGSFVSGECLDIDDKTEAFQKAGKGSFLCNCAIYVAGVDFVDVDCIAWLRATISDAFFKQGLFRGTRVLPGLVNDDMTAEERIAAILVSGKPYTLVIDPLWVHERIDICSIHNLYTDDVKVKDKMKKMSGDFLDNAKAAEEMVKRDAIRTLEKEAQKHKNRQPRTIDPVAFSMRIGADAAAHIMPQTDAESRAASKEELDFLLSNNIDTSQIKNSGQAQFLINQLVKRDREGYASPKQLTMLIKLGFPEDKAVLMKKGMAGVLIGKATMSWRK